VSILGRGDLVPRRRRGRPRWPLLALAFVALAAVGYVGDRYVWPHVRSSSPTASQPLCPTSSPPPPLPAARTVSLRVRNSTIREGLAGEVATALRHRGFHVRGVGNAPVKVTGTAKVRYSADQAQQAKSVAAQVDRPVLLKVGGKGVLDLDLGVKWRALASPTAVRAAERADRASASPTPTCPASAAASGG
jgi:hypothetical protein